MQFLFRSSVLILVLVLTSCGPTAKPALSPAPPLPTSLPTPTATALLTLGNWHDMIYHEQMSQVVLVNGGPENGKSSTAPVELWGWSGKQWTLLSADPNGPQWRNFASVAYDSKRKALVLYGGLTAEQDFEDTWEWDGTRWTQFNAEGPGPREAAGMTYDSGRERVVLFGGAQRSKAMNDTWEWDGVQWTRVSTDGPTTRFPAGFAYDMAHQNVMLFGGHTFDNQGFTTYADTWTWDGVNWQQISSEGPSPRDGARAIFIPTVRQILLFGGAEIGISVTNLNDTWLWNGAQWKQVDVEGPPARVHPALAFDESRGVVVMTGGSNGPGIILSDTWEWDGQTWICANKCE